MSERIESSHNRRDFLLAAAGAAACAALPSTAWAVEESEEPRMRLGLVTYNWGRDWDIPTLIRNCSSTGYQGVELRSTHRHGVEIDLDAKGRAEVAQRFADSDVELVGLGSACEFHAEDPAVVRRNVEEAKAFVKLCHDVGGGGVKVRPNGIPAGVPEARTIEQIGRALGEVAKFAADFGVVVRLEVHGRESAELPRIRRMMDVADHENAVVCWNCNPTDLTGEGLEHNFGLVAKKIEIVHVHDLRTDAYPWRKLFGLLRRAKFEGWTLMEEGAVPEDVLAAMRENRARWETLSAGT
jgi:sugar phosphate isomerase/epimerase